MQEKIINNQDALDALLKKDFSFFVEKSFHELTGGATLKQNFHIDVICDQLNKVKEDEIKRLIINIAPRQMKSKIVSVAFPAFLLGHDPSVEIMCVSYNSSLAEDFGFETMKVMESKWYQRIFPKTILDPKKKSKGDFKTTVGGCRFASGIDGTITGRGADYIIIDDPIKAEDANSETAINKVNNWFDSSLNSRLNNPNEGKIIVVMQRLNENDLTGYLINEKGDY